jgi:hypothetical protein
MARETAMQLVCFLAALVPANGICKDDLLPLQGRALPYDPQTKSF